FKPARGARVANVYGFKSCDFAGKRSLSVMGKATRFTDWPVHDHRCRVVSSRKGAGAGAAPVGEAVTRGRLGTNGDRRASGFPAAVRRHGTACPGVHREVVLGAEFHRIGGVLGRGDGMGDGAGVAPTTKVVANTWATVLR